MFDELDRKMMMLAIEQANRAFEAGEIPVGAVVARGGEVAAQGYNMRERTGDPTAHAEIVAMRKAGERLNDWRLSDCTLYVTLEPCAMCAGAVSQTRLKRVVFGAYDIKAGCCASVYRIPEDPALPGFTPCDGGLLERECARLLGEFFGRNTKAESQG